MPITPRQRDEIEAALTDEVLNRARVMSTTSAKREVIMAALRPLVREAGEGETKPFGDTQGFHAHLDECDQCRNHPMNLCEAGARILHGALRAW